MCWWHSDVMTSCDVTWDHFYTKELTSAKTSITCQIFCMSWMQLHNTFPTTGQPLFLSLKPGSHTSKIYLRKIPIHSTLKSFFWYMWTLLSKSKFLRFRLSKTYLSIRSYGKNYFELKQRKKKRVRTFDFFISIGAAFTMVIRRLRNLCLRKLIFSFVDQWNSMF